MIEASDLRKAYGSVQALDGVTFAIAAGEIVGLLGPNGAGKTTIIKILTGYLQPDTGSVVVDGLDVFSQVQQVQARIGYLPENAPIYPELTVQAYLRLIADLRQIPAAAQRRRISEAIHATGLAEQLTRPIGQLSKGYRQRVGLAQAIVHQPRLLILDEPTVGLDPTQIVEIRHLIRRLAAHSTILFSTHILPEVEALCDRAIILMHGRVRADARLADLATSRNAILVLERAVDGVLQELQTLPGVDSAQLLPSDQGHAVIRVVGQDHADLCPTLYAHASQQRWPVRELHSDRRTLESVFNELNRAAAEVA